MAFISGWGPLDFVARWYDNGENNGAEDAIVGPGGYCEELYLPNIGHGIAGDNRPQREHVLSKVLAFSEARWVAPPGAW